MSDELDAQPASAVQSTTIPRFRIYDFPCPNGVAPTVAGRQGNSLFWILLRHLANTNTVTKPLTVVMELDTGLFPSAAISALKIICEQVSGLPLSEAEHFWKCGGCFDSAISRGARPRGASAPSGVRSSAAVL
jgi:hypothetical protein